VPPASAVVAGLQKHPGAITVTPASDAATELKRIPRTGCRRLQLQPVLRTLPALALKAARIGSSEFPLVVPVAAGDPDYGYWGLRGFPVRSPPAHNGPLISKIAIVNKALSLFILIQCLDLLSALIFEGIKFTRTAAERRSLRPVLPLPHRPEPGTRASMCCRSTSAGRRPEATTLNSDLVIPVPRSSF
jgi:hypothetical protein